MQAPPTEAASGKPARHRPASAWRRTPDPDRDRVIAAGAALRRTTAAGVPGAGGTARGRRAGRHPLPRHPLHLSGRLAVAGDHPVRRRSAHACGPGARQRRSRRAAGDARRAGDGRADRGRGFEAARPAAAGSLPARHHHRLDRRRRGVLPAACRRPAPGAADRGDAGDRVRQQRPGRGVPDHRPHHLDRWYARRRHRRDRDPHALGRRHRRGAWLLRRTPAGRGAQWLRPAVRAASMAGAGGRGAVVRRDRSAGRQRLPRGVPGRHRRRQPRRARRATRCCRCRTR